MFPPYYPARSMPAHKPFRFFPFPRSTAFAPVAGPGMSPQATYCSNPAMRTFLSTYSFPEEWRSCRRISRANTRLQNTGRASSPGK